MESNHNSFPVFVSGQYLTSEHLNEMQSFLWQEEKDSRSFLCGNGIIAGMVTGFEDNTKLKKIKLSSGAASTVDGYLVITDPLFVPEQITGASTIDEFAAKATDVSFDKAVSIILTSLVTQDGSKQLMEKKDFDKLQDKSFIASSKDLNAFEIFAEENKIEDLPEGSNTVESLNITGAQALSNFILLAWVFVVEAENDHCQQGDCNTKGIQRSYITRYFLLDNSQLDQMNVASPPQNTCMVARIKTLFLAGSAAGLQSKSFDAWSASVAELLPYFSNSNPLKQLGIIATLLTADEQTALADASTKFNNIVASVSNVNCPQYYNSFAADLAKAINELVLFYNEYAEKYPTVSRDRIERTVIIGSLSSAGVDKWRYYFIPMTSQVVHIADRKKLTKLFLRVIALVNNFIPGEKISKVSSQVNAVLAIPTLVGDALLQDRAIPYYYDIMKSDTILKYWNPQGGNLKNIFCYYDSVVAERNDVAPKLATADWYNENFFLIEGHIGLTIAAAKSAITNLIVNDGLPIQLLDCDINYKGPQKWVKWHGDFSNLVKTSLKNLREKPETKSYPYDPLKKITTYSLETSYRKPDEMKSILNDLTAYSGVFYNAKFGVAGPKKKKGLTAAAGTVQSPITKEVADNYMKEISKAKLDQLIKDYNDAIVEVKDPTAKKLIVLKDLAGLEYMGGVPRGGTFVLLHSNGTVIGDGCLSFYFRIEQGRIFDQQ